MSETTYTEKDVVLREREAYVRGRHESLSAQRMTDSERREFERDAAVRYPLPKVTRPRVVTRQDGVQLRIEDPELQFRIGPNCSWATYCLTYMSPANRAALLDLLANPTEEVEA